MTANQKSNIPLDKLRAVSETAAAHKEYVDFERSRPKSKTDTLVVTFKAIEAIAADLLRLAEEKTVLLVACKDTIKALESISPIKNNYNISAIRKHLESAIEHSAGKPKT